MANSANEHHFVVVAAIDEKNQPVFKFVEEETEDRLFPDGTIWNTVESEWYAVGDDDDVDEADEKLFVELSRRLSK